MKGLANSEVVYQNTYHSPAVNTDAVGTISAVANEAWVLDWITFGYDVANVAAESLVVTFGGTTKFEVDIPLNGTLNEPITFPHHIEFSKGLYTGTLNEEVLVTLSAAGAAVKGKVNVGYH